MKFKDVDTILKLEFDPKNSTEAEDLLELTVDDDNNSLLKKWLKHLIKFIIH